MPRLSSLLSLRFSPVASVFFLLALTLVATVVWYAAYRANAIALAWNEQNGYFIAEE